MNLIIDVGNTFVKAAVFENDTLQDVYKFEGILLEKEIKKIFKKSSIQSCIISSVGRLNKTDFNFIPVQTLFLNHQSKYPFVNNYETPETIGVDRLVLIAAAHNYKKNSNILVIDAGTCVTFDFLDKNNIYLGGAISPGILMRYKALNNYTNGLPFLNPEQPVHFIGKSTKECIHTGVINGLVNEIDGVISQYTKYYKDLTVILTGGDAYFLSKQLKSSIFATSNFLLEGLNYLLRYNLKE